AGGHSKRPRRAESWCLRQCQLEDLRTNAFSTRSLGVTRRALLPGSVSAGAPAVWRLRTVTVTIPVPFGMKRDPVSGVWINSRQGTTVTHGSRSELRERSRSCHVHP